MLAEVTEPNLFSLLGDTCRAERFPLAASEVWEKPLRLEAGFYCSDGFRAVQAMRNSGFTLATVGDLGTVRWYNLFTRRFVDDANHGAPFLTTSGMMEARPKAVAYLSRDHTPNLDDYVVEEGTLLISRSGTIGNVVVVPRSMSGWAVTEDALRLKIREEENLGPAYCYLQSPIGQFLVKRSQSGSVVTHIYEADVAGLPIPLLPKRLRKRLTDLVTRASALRSEANDLLDDAEREVQQTLGLPDISTFSPSPNVDPLSRAIVFGARRSDQPNGGGFGDLRLDATYHHPTAVALRRHILSRPDGVQLRDLVHDVKNSSLRKRIYVDDEENGVPLLGGKQMIQTRPTSLNYLSRALTRRLKHECVEAGWTMVSSGGTLGRAIFIHRNYEGWIFSQHVMRVIPNETKVYPGFLYAFLASPFGQVQLLQRGYGSVIQELRDFQFLSIVLCVPSDGGRAIHETVTRAHDRRADAIGAEDEAFSLFMRAIVEGRSATEATWGGDY